MDDRLKSALIAAEREVSDVLSRVQELTQLRVVDVRIDAYGDGMFCTEIVTRPHIDRVETKESR